MMKILTTTVSTLKLLILVSGMSVGLTVQAAPTDVPGQIPERDITGVPEWPVFPPPSVINFEEVRGIAKRREYCFRTDLTSSTIDSRKRLYTAHGVGWLDYNGGTMEGQFNVAFSNREHFMGLTDDTSVQVRRSGDSVVVDVTLHRWGNARHLLSDVNVEKVQYGYFITGKYSSPHRSDVRYVISTAVATCPPF